MLLEPEACPSDEGDAARKLGWARLRVPPCAPVPTDRHLRKLLDCPHLHDAHAFEIMSGLPEAWIPGDEAEGLAFCRIARSLRTTTSRRPATVEWVRPELAHQMGGYGFLLASRGRWAAFEARLPRTAAGLHQDLRGAADMAVAFAQEVVVPVLFRAGLCDERHDVTTRSTPAAVAASVLFAGKGLLAILESSADWHRSIVARSQLGPSRNLSWPVPFSRALAPNGVSLTCIGDGAALAAEGAAMGHCVATYGQACTMGRSVIVSATDAAGKRLSTIELSPAPGRTHRLLLVQNLAARNAPPPPEAVEAAAWLAASAGTPALPLREGWRTQPVQAFGGPSPDPCSDAAVDAAAARWSPFLPRPLRDRPALDLAIVEAARSVLRDRFPSGAGVRPEGGIAGGPVPWRKDRWPGKDGDTPSLLVDAIGRRLFRNQPAGRRQRLARALDGGILSLVILVSFCALAPVAVAFGREWLLLSLAPLALALAAPALSRTRLAWRLGRRSWERRAARALAEGRPS